MANNTPSAYQFLLGNLNVIVLQICNCDRLVLLDSARELLDPCESQLIVLEHDLLQDSVCRTTHVPVCIGRHHRHHGHGLWRSTLLQVLVS